MKTKFLSLATIALFAITTISCSKNDEVTQVPPPANVIGAADVLKPNSGFSTGYDLIEDVSGAGSFKGDLDVADFAVETGGILNFVYNYYVPSQQGYVYSNRRSSIDLATKTEINRTASGLNGILTNASSGPVNAFFKPYTNLASVGAYGVCQGDIAVNNPNTNVYYNLGATDFDFTTAQFNLAKVIDNIGNFKYTYIFQGLQNPPNPTLTGVSANINTFNNPSTSSITLAGLFDWRRTTLPVKTCGFLLRNNEMIVLNCDTSTQVTIATVPVTGLSTSSTVEASRFYSIDGNIVGLIFKETTTKKYYTFSYNFTTQILTKGIENSILDYAGAGSDVGGDEFGNLYYSGVAGNGSNTAGVSIYKKNTTGANTLVGADNFLKFGEITKLKYLNNKVYLAVKGYITGTTKAQVSFVKQN